MKPSSKVIAKSGKKSGSRSVPVPTNSKGGYESVSIRPIDNGFIISRSTDKG